METRTLQERMMDGSGLGSSVPHPEAPLVELSEAPEIYADSFATLVVINGVAKISLASVANGPNGQQRRIIGRLVLSLPGVVELHGALGQLVKQMHEQGVMQAQ